MTVIDEVSHDERYQLIFKHKDGTAITNKSYFELKKVEFIELLGRMAE